MSLAVAALFFGFAVQSAGCSKKQDCKSLCQKAKKCSKELGEAMAKSVGMNDEAQLEKATKELEKQFEDVEKCTKECKNSEAKGKDQDKEEKIKACASRSSCEDFAECFVKAAMGQ